MEVRKENVSFHMDGVAFSLKERGPLKLFLKGMFNREGMKFGSLRYVFCSDKRLLGINRQYLGHNDLTDIITFNLAGASEPLEGEIYISIDRVRENAKIFGVSFRNELHRVIFHGALHLCGYRDKTGKEKAEMKEREDFWLKRYFR